MKCTISNDLIQEYSSVLLEKIQGGYNYNSLVRYTVSELGENAEQYLSLLPYILNVYSKNDVDIFNNIGGQEEQERLGDLINHYEIPGVLTEIVNSSKVIPKDYKNTSKSSVDNNGNKPKTATRTSLEEIPNARSLSDRLDFIGEEAAAILTTIKEDSKRIVLADKNKVYKDSVTGTVYERVSRFVRLFDPNAREDKLIDNSIKIGNSIDALARDYFEGELKSYNKYFSIDSSGRPILTFAGEAQFDRFIAQLDSLANDFAIKGETVFTFDARLFSDRLGIAGTTDIITVDRDGKFRIYDIKTKRSIYVKGSDNKRYNNLSFDGIFTDEYQLFTDSNGITEEEKYAKQLNIYALLFEERFGIKIHSLELVPIKVFYPTTQDGYQTIQSTILPNLLLANLDDINLIEPINGIKVISRPLAREKTEIGNLDAITKNSKEYKWLFDTFGESFVKDHWKFLWNVSNSNLWGKFSEGMTTLYSDPHKGTIYHEAWHNFSQMFLSKKELHSLYSELQKLNPELSFREIEEKLANDFMNYMQSTNPESRRPSRNTLFRKMKNFILKVLGIKSSSEIAKENIDSLYRNLATGNFNKKSFSIDNFSFDELFSSKSLKITEEYTNALEILGKIPLVSGSTSQAVKSLNSLFSNEILDFVYNSKNFSITNILNEETFYEYEESITGTISDSLDNKINEQLSVIAEINNIEYEDFSDLYDKVVAHLLSKEGEKSIEEERFVFYNSVIQDEVLKPLLQEYYNEYFYETSSLFEDIEEEDGSPVEISDNQSADYKENTEDPQKALNKYLKFLLNNVKELNASDTGYETILNKYGFEEASSSTVLYNIILRLTSDINTYDQKYYELVKVTTVKPALLNYLRLIPAPSIEVMQNIYDSFPNQFSYIFESSALNTELKEGSSIPDLIGEIFENFTDYNYRSMINSSISKTNERVFTQFLSISQNDKEEIETIVRLIKGSRANNEKLSNYLNKEFQNNSVPIYNTHSKIADSVILEVAGETTSIERKALDLDKIAAIEIVNFKPQSISAATTLFAKLGLHLSPLTIESLSESGGVALATLQMRLIKYVTQYKEVVDQIEDLALEDELLNITKPIDFYNRGYKILNSRIREVNKGKSKKDKLKLFDEKENSIGSDIKVVLNTETLSNLNFASNTVLTADNKQQTEFPHEHTISKIVNLVNDTELFPKYQDLIQHPIFQHWDISKNPLADNLIVNSLFNLNEKSKNYGNRRKTIKGNYEKIDVHNMNGLNIESNSKLSFNNFKSSGLNVIDGFLFLSALPTHYEDGHYMTLPGERSGQRIFIPPTNLYYNSKSNIGKKFKPGRKGEQSDYDQLTGDIDSITSSSVFQVFKKYLNNEYKRIHSTDVAQDLKKYSLSYLILNTPSGKQVKAKLIGKNFYEEFDAQLFAKAIVEYIESASDNIIEYLSSKGIENITKVANIYSSQKEFIRYHTLNFYIYKIEESLLFYNDSFFMVDPFKRFKTLSSGGKIPTNDKSINDFFNKKDTTHRGLYKKQLMERDSTLEKGSIVNQLKTSNDLEGDDSFLEDGTIRTETIQKIPGEFKESFLQHLENIGSNSVMIENLRKGIEDGADAAAITTLDFYRIRAIRLGQWIDEVHQRAYENYINNGYLTEKEAGYFYTMKDLYAGSTKDSTKPTIHKMAISLIVLTKEQYEDKNDPNKKLEAYILTNKKDYQVVVSGSKGEKPSEMNSFNDILTKDNLKSANEQKLFYEFYKQQIEKANTQKNVKTFGSQFRKLFFSDLFNLGVPVDVGVTFDEWEKLDEKQKQKDSQLYTLFQKYKTQLDSLVSNQFKKIEGIAGVKLNGDVLEITDPKLLRSYLIRNLTSSGLDASVVDFLKVGNDNKFEASIEVSQYKYAVQQALINILVSNITNMKVNGEGMVQTPAVIKNNKLNFYDTVTDKDGNTIVTPMEVGVSFSDNYVPLLNLEYIEDEVVKTVKTITKLNELLRDDVFFEKNKKYLEILIYRIPTQDMPSIDVAVVRIFVLSSSEIQVSPEYLKKTGSDFDNDKIFTFKPSIKNIYKPIQQEANKMNYVFMLKQKLVENGTIKEKDSVSTKDLDRVERENTELYEEIEKEYRSNNPKEYVFEGVGFRKDPINNILGVGHELLQNEHFQRNLFTTIDSNLLETKAIEILKAKIKYLRKDKSSSYEFKQAVLNLIDLDPKAASLELGKDFVDNINEFGNFFDPMRHMIAHENYLGGERGLEIVTKLRATIELYKAYNSSLKEKFEYKGVELLTYNKVGEKGKIDSLTLGDIGNAFSKKSKIFSELINIFVDRGTNPALITALNLSPSMVPIAAHMLKLNVDAEAIFYFISSPIVVEYSKQMDAFDSIAFKLENYDKYKNEKGFLIKSMYKYEVVAKLLNLDKESPNSTGEVYKLFSKLAEENLKKPISSKSLNKDIIKGTSSPASLIQLLMYEAQSDKLREEESLLSFDTNKVSSLLEAKIRSESLENLKEDSILSNDTIDHLINNTVVSSLKLDKILSNSFTELYSVYRTEEFEGMLDKVLEDHELKKLNNDSTQKIIRSFENDFTNFVLQTVNTFGNGTVQDKMKTFRTDNSITIAHKIILADRELDRLFKNDPSFNMEREFPLLSNIETVVPGSTKIFIVNWIGNNLSGEYASEIREHWNSVLNDNNYFLNKPEAAIAKKYLKDLYTDLIAAAMFQYGLNKTPTSFTSAVPILQYTKVVNLALNKFKLAKEYYNKYNNNLDFYMKDKLKYNISERNDKYKLFEAENKFKNDPMFRIYKSFLNYNYAFKSNNPQYFYNSQGINEGFLKNYLTEFKSKSIDNKNEWMLYIPNVYSSKTDVDVQLSVVQNLLNDLEETPLKILASSGTDLSDNTDLETSIASVVPGIINLQEPLGEKIQNGVYVNQKGLNKEEQLELFNYLKPYLEEQASKTNKGSNAPKMMGLNLRWDYVSNNDGSINEKTGKKSNDNSAFKIDIADPIVNQKHNYAYYSVSIDGKPLGNTTNRFNELIEKVTGINIENYDAAIINLYDDLGFISNHTDVEESKSASKYPVVAVNIGGSGNFNINNESINLKDGAGYSFGFEGKNRTAYHRTFPSKSDGFLPQITTKQDGKTYEKGSYRITITMRRAMPLTSGMPIQPKLLQNNSQDIIYTPEENFGENNSSTTVSVTDFETGKKYMVDTDGNILSLTSNTFVFKKASKIKTRILYAAEQIRIATPSVDESGNKYYIDTNGKKQPLEC